MTCFIKANLNNKDIPSIIKYAEDMHFILDQKDTFYPIQTASPKLLERVRVFRDFIHFRLIVSELRRDLAQFNSHYTKEDWSEEWGHFLEKITFNLIELTVLPEISQKTRCIFLDFFKNHQSHVIHTQEQTFSSVPYFSLSFVCDDCDALPEYLRNVIGIYIS